MSQRICPGPPGTTRCPTRSLTSQRWCPPCQRLVWAQRDAQRGSSSARGYDATYRNNRTTLLSHSDVCWLCGQSGANTADHVIPLRHGGTSELANLAPAHKSCNSKRGAR